jgi:hypothetical protein
MTSCDGIRRGTGAILLFIVGLVHRMCVVRGNSEAVYLVRGSALFLWFVEPHKRDRPKKPDEPDPYHAPRNGFSYLFTSLAER